ncbi:bifunctional diguanylate cyclase/phosphodiesterase [Burkholderia sp. Ac-20365]|uniref:bifunctional diguanylate cyclase/phosphodiesterase n=1 Tax=Burkholderia sp. Ac-20365 TaxID=2703897 RepID=UPI00197B9770|nr:bifunctional diguanylate cyclase/phosphodiesterase [Burkholderia sp. Ac-20365]MBN3762434.1 EAL domain-containing protein [Burkholderia sp. Ac-20365]
MLFSPTEQTSDAGFRSRFHRRSLDHQRPLSTVTMAFTVVAYITFACARSLVAGPAVPIAWRLACALVLALLVVAIPRTKSTWVFGGIGVAYTLVLLSGLALSVAGLDEPLLWALPAMVVISICAAPLWLTPAHFWIGTALFYAAGVPFLLSLPHPRGDVSVVCWMWILIAVPTSAVFHFGFYWFRRNHFLLEDRLARLAATDPLTGLQNRRAFLEQAALRLSKLDSSAKTSAIFLDIDYFKSLNDQFGHAVGDQALSDVARVLKEMTAAGDIVSRIGGEEFALLHDAALRPAAQLAETLRTAIGKIARPDGQLSASFGVAEYRPGESVMALLDRADEALLRAKYSGRNRVCAERATLVDPVRLTWTHARADDGMASQPVRQQWDDFWLTSHFQPLYSLSHQKQVGFEALLRGEREDGAQVPPAELFSPKPFTDQGELDRTSHALHLNNARRLIPDDAWVFLNILPATFVADGYPDQLAQIARDAGIPPGRVVLELLESHGGSVDDMSRAAGQYRDHGFLIAVDDFGAGHSNLDRLLRIRPDLVKLDGELIRAKSPGADQPILPKLVSLLHQAGMLVVVEGVETTEQLILAVESNVDFAQGYLLGRPAPTVTPPDAVHRRIDHAFDVIAEGRAHQHALFESEVLPYRRALDVGVDAWLRGVPLNDAFYDLAQMELCISCFVLDDTGRQIGHEVTGKASVIDGGSLHPVANPRDARWDHRPYFRNAVLRPGVPITSSPYLSLASGRPCIAVTVALQSDVGRCVVGAELDWSLQRLPWPTAEHW